jgi:hypothetical protein
MKTSIRFLLLFVFAFLYVSSASAVYDPRLGRWLSRDPIGEAGGFNLYAYCGNDPVNRHDPLGLADWMEVRPIADATGFFAAQLFYVDDNATWWGHSAPQFIGGIRQDGWVDLGNGRVTSLTAIVDEVDDVGTDFAKFFKSNSKTLPRSAIEKGEWDTGGGFAGSLLKNRAMLAGELTPELFDEVRIGADAMANMVKLGAGQYIPGLALTPSFTRSLSLVRFASASAKSSLKFVGPQNARTLGVERALLADKTGAAAFKTPWTAPQGWRLPTTNGSWAGTPGNSFWRSDIAAVNQMTGNRPIRFVEGYIDFSPFMARHYKFPNLSGTNADFALADAQLAIDLQLNSANAARIWRTQNKLTWHHFQDAETLQLVPTILNDIPHVGGASILRR